MLECVFTFLFVPSKSSAPACFWRARDGAQILDREAIQSLRCAPLKPGSKMRRKIIYTK